MDVDRRRDDMNAHQSAQPYPDFPSLALAHERIAVLRAEAERDRLVRAARGPRRRLSWSAGVVAALRESLAGSLPASRRVARRQTCATC
jgi:hypothetical protein